jgi:hypothetical protein
MNKKNMQHTQSHKIHYFEPPEISMTQRRKRQYTQIARAEQCAVQSAWKKPRAVSPLNQKRVRFSEEPNQVKTRDMSSEDLKNTWLQREELNAIREENFRILRALKHAHNGTRDIDPKMFCTRGLEVAIYRVLYRRNTQKEVARYIVYQHKMQRALGQEDPAALRLVSQQLTAIDRSRALLIASEDEYHSKYC